LLPAREYLWLPVVVGATLFASSSRPARACRLLQYAFEPDCLARTAAGNCKFDVTRPDFGPQIAVWIETADGSRFVDTLMVTNAVALYGIGNRPGRWDFRSGPRFPYGRRPMALPVWAHHRGQLYPQVVMGDGLDDSIAAHMQVSSPEPHFCRPMMQSEVLDAVTCPSGLFRSSKGVFDATAPKSYYPPRGDLVDWADLCVPLVSSAGTSCDYGDARQFGLINDLDAVATATPRYDAPFIGTWQIPGTLADGDYALLIEVGKEFDGNSAFSQTSYLSAYEAIYYNEYGLDGNLGQPSVVYRVPFHLSSAPIPPTAITVASGYGDWTGETGELHMLDGHIGRDPGSGEGRLRIGDGAGGTGRAHLVEQPCASVDCSQGAPLEPPPIDASIGAQSATSAGFTFRQVADRTGASVISYELRYAPVGSSFLDQVDETAFTRWAPAPAPPVAPPNTVSHVTIDNLAPQSSYAIGLRALGACGWSKPSFARITTGAATYQRLSGCVIATAAYGSDLDPDVSLLRGERDEAAARSGMVRLAALLYGQSAPPLAELIRRSEPIRAVVRSLLRPIVSANRAALATTRTASPAARPAAERVHNPASHATSVAGARRGPRG